VAAAAGVSAATGGGVAVTCGAVGAGEAGADGAVWALATEPQTKAARTSAVGRWRVTVWGLLGV